VTWLGQARASTYRTGMTVVIVLAVVAGLALIAALYVRSVRRTKAIGHRTRSVSEVGRQRREEQRDLLALQRTGNWRMMPRRIRDPNDSGFEDQF
jgi:hypothetical protein